MPARTLYWWKTGAAATWATVAGNWWTIAANPVPSGAPATWIAGETLVQAASIPAAGDSIYLLADGSHVAPSTGPAADLSCPLFDTTCCLAALTTTVLSAHVIIATGGLLNLGVIGDSAGTYSHAFGGSAPNATTVTTYGLGSLQTDLTANEWISYDLSSNQANFTGNWFGHDNSINSGTLVGNYINYGNAHNENVIFGDGQLTPTATLRTLIYLYENSTGAPGEFTMLSGLPDPSIVIGPNIYGPPDALQTGTASAGKVVDNGSGVFGN